MIGLSHLSEGFQFHIPKGFIYFAMFFSFLVDVIQMRAGIKKGSPIRAAFK
jgi:predicted tellurium resistance membrane protein TerC